MKNDDGHTNVLEQMQQDSEPEDSEPEAAGLALSLCVGAIWWRPVLSV